MSRTVWAVVEFRDNDRYVDEEVHSLWTTRGAAERVVNCMRRADEVAHSWYRRDLDVKEFRVRGRELALFTPELTFGTAGHQSVEVEERQ